MACKLNCFKKNYTEDMSNRSSCFYCGKVFDRLKYFITGFLLFVLLINSVSAQTVIVKDSPKVSGTTVVYPGIKYLKNGLHNALLGKHYRTEWATPLRVKNFYLDTAKGGLEIVKESGSRQSYGLRLQSKNGKQYVLRSIDKDFGRGFDDIYQGTFITNTAKDQVSFGYPGAAVSITPMISAAGIYHTNPIIVFVPKQKTLGEYNDKYGDQLYLFEERADEDQSDAPWFGNSKNVIGSEKLNEKVFGDNDNKVDQESFVRARLFDMLVGDWGRHEDQWRWAEFKNDGKAIYKPIPRDRDQVYTIFDGLLPFLATHVAGGTNLKSFTDDIKKIKKFNKPGRSLDLRFTNELTEAQWLTIAADMQQKITDDVIDAAMKQLPVELYSLKSTTTIANHLKARRDNLQNFAKRYYAVMAKQVLIYGSDESEMFVVNRISAEQTEIKVYKINKKGNAEAAPYYSRKFLANETKEIRLFGFKDADVFKLTGDRRVGIKIKILGVTKKDSVVFNATGKDKLTMLKKGDSNLYDSVYTNKFKVSPVIFVNPKIFKLVEDEKIKLFTTPGLHIGLSLTYSPKEWKRKQDEFTHNLMFNYGFLRKSLYLDYIGVAPHLIGKFDFLMKGKFDIVAGENFHGIGNETTDSAGTATNYYNVFSQRIYGGLGITRTIAERHQVDATVFFQDVKVYRDNDSYILQKFGNLPEFNHNKFAGISAGYHFSNVNNKLVPTKGVNFKIGLGYVTSADKSDYSFFKGISEFSFYVPMGKLLSFASRAGGGVLQGDAPYYYLNDLGGNDNLRGFTRERFYGKTSFYNNNELRLITNTRNVVFNGKAGVFGFLDNGRVWQPSESSTKWHVGYGAGLMIAPFNKFVLMASYGLSEEGGQITANAKMFF
jgi:hypothetical protein